MRSLTLATALALLATGALAQDAVRLATEAAYPPFNFLNDAGEVDGFERELGDELCRRAELACEWVANEWDSIIPNLVSGNYDAVIAGMSITEERDAVIDFTEEYYPNVPSAYAALSADADVETGVVAAQANTIQAAHIAETGATLIEFTSPDETVAAVQTGEADAVFADRDFLTPFVDQSQGEMSFVGEPVLLGSGVGIGVRESDEALKEKLDAAIASMKTDGSLNELIVKWFGEDALTFQDS